MILVDENKTFTEDITMNESVTVFKENKMTVAGAVKEENSAIKEEIKVSTNIVDIFKEVTAVADKSITEMQKNIAIEENIFVKDLCEEKLEIVTVAKAEEQSQKETAKETLAVEETCKEEILEPIESIKDMVDTFSDAAKSAVKTVVDKVEEKIEEKAEKEERKVQENLAFEQECVLKVVHPKTAETSGCEENQGETKSEVNCNHAQSSNNENISEPVAAKPSAEPEEIPYIDEGNDQMEEKETSSKATFDEDLDTSEEMQKHINEVEAVESEKLQDFADGIEEREAEVESPVTEEIVEPIEAIIDEVEIESDNIETGSEESTTPEIIDTKQSKSNACKFFLVAILFAILALIITFCSFDISTIAKSIKLIEPEPEPERKPFWKIF